MRQRTRRLFLPLCFFITALTGCTRSAGVFSEPNARAHVAMLAGTIGSRPAGTEANARARAYLIDQLRAYGYEVRVQEADARRPELGRTARVSNIIAVLPGARREAIGLVAHYDSVPESPGAGDDAFGAAIVLETARVLAAAQTRTWSIFVLLTDGEETRLMGAAALVTDREVTSRLHAYVNIEAAGASGNAMLFQTGPGNDWIARVWARRAPHPRGASFGTEIYRRLPNDTDFTIFARQEIPGLNFALAGDGYAYHTALDTPERLSTRSLRDTGENVVAIAGALDRVDITRRSGASATYFDIGGVSAVSYSMAFGWLIAAASLVVALLAWIKMTTIAIRLGGWWRYLFSAVWSLVGLSASIAAMIAATWGLRAAREVLHPWHARPDRMLLLLLAAGVTAGWAVSRAGAWLPRRAHGLRHPALTWSLALPLWFAITAAVIWTAPSAAMLWTLPLLTAGVLLLVTPSGHATAIRVASVAVLAVVATLWLRNTVDVLRFLPSLFGRLPFVTPVYAYAAFMTAAGVMIAPPFLAAAAATQPLVRPSLVTSVCLVCLAIAAGFAYAAPAYTTDQPQRRVVRALQEADGTSAIWEVASIEPGLDLGDGAPGGWSLQSSAAPATVPWGMLAHPFVFRTTGPALGPPPLDIAGFAVEPVEAGTEVTVTAVPRRQGIAVSFVLPQGITPARSSLPGLPRLGRWTATFVAPPADGVVWRARFARVDPARLRDIRVVVTDSGFPGGNGWQRLPGWLPQDRAVWNSTATWVVPPGSGPPLATGDALR